ncbi:MAG: F0F1 ATP synthase subunit alpha, partial [Clostridium sp.]|nr:F0F1 ATP synthase subunit alpha [Clostridium sp.]
DQYSPMPVENQIVILFATVNDFLSDIKVSDVRRFERELLEYMDTHNRDLLKKIVEVQKITDDIKTELENSIVEFKKIFLQDNGNN